MTAKLWGTKKDHSILCLWSGRAESDNGRVCGDHLVKLAFCGFVYATLADITVPFLCKTEVGLFLCRIGVCTSTTQQQYKFYEVIRRFIRRLIRDVGWRLVDQAPAVSVQTYVVIHVSSESHESNHARGHAKHIQSVPYFEEKLI